MHVTAKADYAVRAVVELSGSSQDAPRAVEGPLVGVRGQRPEEIEYVGSAESLQQVWVALRSNLRKVLEHVTVADVAAGKLPKDIVALTKQEEAWETR
jgi:DNA-binding IscR family transcriptional regulator